MRFLALTLALVAGHAGAQTTMQQIQTLSPQLVSFAGSDANLQSLVNGLSLGQPVTVVTQGVDGVLQIATFTPPNALGADVSRSLEQARTNLLARGITNPTAQQIGVALMGGVIATSAGQVSVPGVLTNTIPTTQTVQVRNEFAGGTAAAATPFGGSVANFQSLSNGLQRGAPITLTSTVNGVPQSVTFTSPTGPLAAADANQLLQLASQQLASLGIINPTPQQIQTALLGGSVPVSGGTVQLAGVLQNRTVNTSTSNLFGTSNSPLVTVPGVIGTSNSGVGGTTPAGSGSPGVGTTTTPFVGVDGVRRANTAEGGALRAPVTGR
jgi:hypothetical protein